MKRALFACGLMVLWATSVMAQPYVAVSTTVVSPGQPVAVAIHGGPGQFYAVIGSSVNGGFSYAGVPLGVGPDVAILAMGRLDGAGNVAVAVTPPFNGTVLDRYYLQAVTSTSPSFVPPQPTAVAVVRNADLVAGLAGPQGPQGPQGVQGPPGPTGPPGLSGVTTVQVTGTVAASTTGGAALATCPAGTRVIAGGAGSQSTDLRMYTSAPSGSTRWLATFVRNSASNFSSTFQVYAICAVVAQ